MIDSNQQWDLSLLSISLLEEVTKFLYAQPFPYIRSSLPDTLIWNHNSGVCSVKSAYQSLLNWTSYEPRSQISSWTWIWKLRVPLKIRLFIWKCAHHRIPTKSIIFSHSTDSSQLCPRCQETETPMHVLRDCVFAKNIWLLYGQSSLLPNFFTLPFQSWCKVNLSISCLSSYIPWSTVFAFTIWVIWLGRNSFIVRGDLFPMKL